MTKQHTWGPSNPLWRWQQKHKGYKHKRRSKTSDVRKMPRKRRYSRRSAPRRWYRRFRRGKQPIPLLPLIPVVYRGIVEPIFGGDGMEGAKAKMDAGDMIGALKEFGDVVSINFTGYKPSDASFWGWDKPVKTYTMIGMGLLGHMIANKVGANRQMKKVPLIGKYIQF